MRAEGAGGTHDGTNKRQRHSTGQLCRKYCRKPGGGDGVRGKRSGGKWVDRGCRRVGIKRCWDRDGRLPCGKRTLYRV